MLRDLIKYSLRAIIVIMLTLVTLMLHKQANASEHACMSKALYYESREELHKCQQMVADVIFNRMRDKRFPNTVCNVVYQPRQFSWTRKPYTIREHKLWQESQQLATKYLHQYKTGKWRDTTHGSLYFSTGKRLGNVRTRCGAHVFMR